MDEAIEELKLWLLELVESIDTADAIKSKPTWSHAEVVKLLVTMQNEISDRLPTIEDDEWDDE